MTAGKVQYTRGAGSDKAGVVGYTLEEGGALRLSSLGIERIILNE
jgi:hypothetical protein